jgi:hypothetical protein
MHKQADEVSRRQTEAGGGRCAPTSDCRKEKAAPPPYPPLASKGKQTHKPDATSGSPSKPLPSVQRRRRCQMGRTGPVLRKICVVEGRIEFGRQPTGEGGCRQAKAGDGTKRRQKDGRRQTPPLR